MLIKHSCGDPCFLTDHADGDVVVPDLLHEGKGHLKDMLFQLPVFHISGFKIAVIHLIHAPRFFMV